MLMNYVREHYGDIASVVGLVITLVGFVATIINVRKAKRAAEDARQAAREAVSRIGSQLLVNEIGTALQLVREIDAACREKHWTAATFRSDEARTRLATFLENPRLTESELVVMGSVLDEFGIVLSDIQKLQASPESKQISQRLANRLHKIITALGRIMGRLQSETLEV